jgi:hypothetical protein
MAAIEGLCKEAEVVMRRVAPVTDLIIKSRDGKDFAVSKALLAASSEVFANMFADLQGGVKTRGAKADVEPVTLEETSKEIILLINHVYAGPHYQVTPSDMFSGLWLAKKYDMPRLGEACRAYLDGVHLGEQNTPGWLAVAPGYEVARFTKRCVEYAAGALQGIIDYRVGQQLPATDWLEKLPPSMLVEIMQLRTRTVGCLASALDKQNKLLSDQDIAQLEKRPRWF